VPDHRTAVMAPEAPKPAGPYSHAVQSGGLLFCSGQVPIDPATGALAEGSIGDQARQCLENLKTVCAAAGADLAHAVRMAIYVTDISTFGQVNEAYGAYFGSDPPARTTIGVAALPGGAQIEMDAIVALSR
jgi:2-iminobutanoate/2-iminopropanoate deaminase